MRAARHFVNEVLSDVSEMSDVVLAVSELATNAVRHAATMYTVRLLMSPELIRLEVSDGSPVVPTIGSDSHRGLRIVEGVSESWGVEPNRHGKTVWAEFAVDSG